MRQKLTLTISAFLLLILSVTSINVAGQSTYPDGKPIPGGGVYAPSNVDNFIFGWSGYSSNNVLILNGIAVPVLKSGWYHNDGEHSSGNQNYICGQQNDGTLHHNFFAISLANLSSYGIVTPITSAELRIDRYTPAPLSGSQLYTLFNVTTSWALIDQSYSVGSSTGQSIFNDLGSGTNCGSVVVDKTLSGSPMVSVTINSAGISAINSSIGSVIIFGGVAGDTVPVPVSMWVMISAFVLIAMAVAFRFRRRIF